MYSRSHVLALAVLAGLVAGLARAEPPADIYGDPLPEGAVLRLGTARLKSSASQMLFTPDGRTLITLEDGRCVKRWNAEDGALRRTFTLPGPCWYPAALSPDGSRFVGGDGREGVAVWDVTSGNLVCKVPSGVCNFVAFSLDGATLVTAAWQNQLRFWDARTGAARPSPGEKYHVFNAVFSPDGSRFAWSEPGAVICMDLTTGKEAWRKEIRAAQVACSPGGVLAVRAWPNKGKNENVTEDDPSEIRFLRIADGKPDGREPVPCSGQAITLQYSPDGGALAWRTCKEIAVCDLKTGKQSRTLPIAKAGWPGELFAFAPDGKTLTALVGRTLHRWDLSTGKDFYADVSGRGHNGPVVAVAWSPDGKRIATMSQDFQASVCVWDAGTGKLLRTLPASEERWFAWCYRLAFTPDGGRLLAAGGDNVIHCWDLSTGKEMWNGAALDAESKQPMHLDRFHLTADGKRLLTLTLANNGSWGPGTEIVWDPATGERLQGSTVLMASGSDAYSPDGRLRIIWTGDVYDDETGTVRWTLSARYSINNESFLDTGVFSPDGELFAAPLEERVAAGQTNETVCRGIQVWERATGKRVTLIAEKAFGRLAFASDGRTIAVVGEDGLRAWDAVTGEEVYRQPVASGLLGRLPIALSPDGRRLVAVCTDTTAVVWDLSSIPRRKASGKSLTAKERDALWADLADADAAKAYAAIDRLAARPDDAAALLRDRLRPAVGVSKDRVHRLIAALDDDDFDAREAASRQLADIAERIEPSLRNALGRDDLTPEQRSRIGRALASVPAAPPTETLRGLRAVRALAWAGSPDARAVLEKLAAGAADDPLTREARAALARWKKEK